MKKLSEMTVDAVRNTMRLPTLDKETKRQASSVAADALSVGGAIPGGLLLKDLSRALGASRRLGTAVVPAYALGRGLWRTQQAREAGRYGFAPTPLSESDILDAAAGGVTTGALMSGVGTALGAKPTMGGFGRTALLVSGLLASDRLATYMAQKSAYEDYLNRFAPPQVKSSHVRPKLSEVTTDLKPHQQRVVRRISDPDQSGLVVYHGLGSGKTLGSIAAAESLGGKTAVYVPAALRENYRKEIAKHTAAQRAKYVIDSIQRAARGKVVKDADLVIVDEAHRARNPGATQKNIGAALSNADKRLLLSATPIYNHPADLASLVNLAAQDNVLPSDASDFERKFVVEKEVKPSFFGRFVRGITPGVRKELTNKRELGDVLGKYVDFYRGAGPGAEGFPSRKDETIDVPMTDLQYSVYQGVSGTNPDLAYKIKAGLPPSKKEVSQLNAFANAVRQVANSPINYIDKLTIDQALANAPKITTAVDRLRAAADANPRHKAVVYSNYLDSGLNLYAHALQQQGIPFGQFTGQVKAKERKQIIDDYNTDKLKALLVSSAGAEGLDLKGTRQVQIIEPHWNDPKLDQVIGRAIRYKSHDHLPPGEQNVIVEHYNAVLPNRKGISRLIRGKRRGGMAIDHYLRQMSAEKSALQGDIEALIEDRQTKSSAAPRIKDNPDDQRNHDKMIANKRALNHPGGAHSLVREGSKIFIYPPRGRRRLLVEDKSELRIWEKARNALDREVRQLRRLERKKASAPSIRSMAAGHMAAMQKQNSMIDAYRVDALKTSSYRLPEKVSTGRSSRADVDPSQIALRSYSPGAAGKDPEVQKLLERAEADKELSGYVHPENDLHRTLIYYGGNLVGFMTPREVEGGWRAGAMYVDENVRKKYRGIGRGALRQFFADKPASPVLIGKSNLYSRKAFEGAGFSDTGRSYRGEDGWEASWFGRDAAKTSEVVTLLKPHQQRVALRQPKTVRTEKLSNPTTWVHTSPHLLHTLEGRPYSEIADARSPEYMKKRLATDQAIASTMGIDLEKRGRGFLHLALKGASNMSGYEDYPGFTYEVDLPDDVIEKTFFDVPLAHESVPGGVGKEGLKKALQIWEQATAEDKADFGEGYHSRIEAYVPSNIPIKTLYPQVEDRAADQQSIDITPSRMLLLKARDFVNNTATAPKGITRLVQALSKKHPELIFTEDEDAAETKQKGRPFASLPKDVQEKTRREIPKKMLRNAGRKFDRSDAIYHGSREELKGGPTLQPHYLTNDLPTVFGTPLRGMAMAFLGKRWTDDDFDLGSVSGGPLTLRELRPGALRETFQGQKGHLYTMDATPFVYMPQLMGEERVALRQPKTVRTEKIPDIYEALLSQNDMKVVPFQEAVEAEKTSSAIPVYHGARFDMSHHSGRLVRRARQKIAAPTRTFASPSSGSMMSKRPGNTPGSISQSRANGGMARRGGPSGTRQRGSYLSNAGQSGILADISQGSTPNRPMATPGFAEAGKGISGSVGMAPLPKAPSPPTPIMKSNLDTTPKTPTIPKISNVARQWARRAGDFMMRHPYFMPVVDASLVASALSQSREADGVYKILPALGAAAGMMYGLRRARRLPVYRRLPAVLDATAIGATAGSLPYAFKTRYDTSVENQKTSNVAQQWARRAGDLMNRHPYAKPVVGAALVAGALSQSRDADDMLKILPALGASAGMLYGLRHARQLPPNQRLPSVFAATATGASAGWLPDVFKTGYDTLVENKKTSAAVQSVMQPAQSLFAGAKQVALAPFKVSPLTTLGVGSYFGLDFLRRHVGDPIDRMARDQVRRRPKPFADLFRTYRQGANAINPYKLTAPGSFRTHPHGGYAPKFG